METTIVYRGYIGIRVNTTRVQALIFSRMHLKRLRFPERSDDSSLPGLRFRLGGPPTL